MYFPLAIFGLLATYFATRKTHDPLDSLPDWVRGQPLAPDAVTASSGRLYSVRSFRPVGDRALFIARPKGIPNVWISYIHNRRKNTRQLWRASSDRKSQLRQMQADFKIERAK